MRGVSAGSGVGLLQRSLTEDRPCIQLFMGKSTGRSLLAGTLGWDHAGAQNAPGTLLQTASDCSHLVPLPALPLLLFHAVLSFLCWPKLWLVG